MNTEKANLSSVKKNKQSIMEDWSTIIPSNDEDYEKPPSDLRNKNGKHALSWVGLHAPIHLTTHPTLTHPQMA